MNTMTLQIHPLDNVVVALRPLRAGETVGQIVLKNDIPLGHKIASRDIKMGEPVIKYGYPIGIAAVNIRQGEHVDEKNIKSTLRGKLESATFNPQVKSQACMQLRQFEYDGYVRPNGQVGSRNEIWIINTVGCVNHASTRIAETAAKALVGKGIDGVHAFPHPYGCSQLGDDLNYTQKVLAGLVNHPNAGGVLILGLGCENNQMKLFLEQLGPQNRDRVRYFNAQEVSDEIESGLDAVQALAEYAQQFKRQRVDARHLIPAMKCGGSDGLSGITANPLVGRVADRFTAGGATVLLSEVPEMFGAEQVLLDRACNREVFEDTIRLVNDFRSYFERYNQPIDENPSPGNKAGGISTLAEKSLGCVQKGGDAPVKQVLGYGQPARAGLGGLALVNAPGNDGVSCTAMTVAGAHVILFTTGRGTPMGFPVPTLKISTNTDLATRKPQWIDFDAGRLISEGISAEELADQLTQLVLDVASGRKQTRNEQHGYREIAIWKDGVTV
ncbi:MAG: altronate hydrolase [Phycisphaerae bacterium]|jgi:altronate hydrolase|nr:MAG: altronate hydrolase [Phycisphaerae bacterium]